MHSPPVVKSVHHALEDYNLLNVRLLQDTTQLNISGAKAWRMNLCALSERDPTVAFVVVDDCILVYHISHFLDGLGKPVRQLATRSSEIEEQYTINQLKVARLFDEEALVAVTDAGEIWIWRTDQLDVPPIVLNNDDSSTWGVAIHSDQGLIAVSANNYKVTVFNMQCVPAARQMFGHRRLNIPPVMDDTIDKIHLIGHQDNIPCVDFNHSGRFLASCSIDQTCRIWDLKTGQQVTERQLSTNRRDRNYWCWAVKFVSLRDFKAVGCATEQLSQKLSNRIHQGRSTSLQSLNLHHSAPNPIYRVNLPDFDGGPTGGLAFQMDFLGSDYEDGFTEDEESVQLDDEEHQMLNFRSVWQQHQQAAMQQWSQGGEVNISSVVRGNEGSTEDDDEEGGSRGDANTGSDSDTEIPQAPSPDEQEDQDAEAALSINMSDFDMDDPELDFETHLTDWDPNDIDIESDWFDEGGEDDEDAVFMQHGPDQGHRLLSAEDHRNLREQLQNERWSLQRPPIPTVQPIPVSSKGGWSDTDEGASGDESSAITNALKEDEPDEAPSRPSVVPPVMRPSFLFSDSAISNKTKKRRDMFERLVVTTPKDLFLLQTNTGSMMTERLERGIISNVDVRSDRMLMAMDRLNMIQWIPELELFVCASQKGTIALMRMLHVKLRDGQHTIMFNHERYLPDHGMQSKSLYGLSAQRIHGDRCSSPVYILYLFYYDGAVLSYRISRQNDELFADPLVI